VRTDIQAAWNAVEAKKEAILAMPPQFLAEAAGYARAPEALSRTMAAAGNLYGMDLTSWGVCRRFLNNQGFFETLQSVDADIINPSIMMALRPYYSDTSWTEATVGRISEFAGLLCSWVRAVYEYVEVAHGTTDRGSKFKELRNKGQQLALDIPRHFFLGRPTDPRRDALSFTSQDVIDQGCNDDGRLYLSDKGYLSRTKVCRVNVKESHRRRQRERSACTERECTRLHACMCACCSRHATG
jgi:hypothetical protein